MTMVRTDLGNLRESARRIRFEIVPGIDHTDVQTAIQQVASQPPAVVPTSINFGMSPYNALSTDTVIYVDTSGGAVTINLQAAALRLGKPIVIKDSTGHANANNITIVPNGAETIETNPNFAVNADFGGVRLNPVSGSGWLDAP